jgi:hypothetical protein
MSADWATLSARLTGLKSAELTGHVEAALDASHVKLRSGEGAPKNWQAELDAASVKTTLDRDTFGRFRGPLSVATYRARAGLGTLAVVADTTAKLQVMDLDLLQRTLDLGGSVQTTDVSLKSGGRSMDAWWAKLDISRAHFDFLQDLDIQGGVLARFRNGLPVLSLFGEEASIPRWVPTVLPLNGLSFAAQVERHCKWTSVTVLDAQGGPLVAKGGVQMKGDDLHGGFLVSLGLFKPLAVGLGIDAEKVDVSLFAGQHWLDGRLARLSEAAKGRRVEACVPTPPQCR